MSNPSAKVIEYAAATISLALDKMVADLPDTAAPQAALEVLPVMWAIGLPPDRVQARSVQGSHARQAAGRSGIRKQAATATGALRRLYLDQLPLCALSAMRSLAQEI